MLTAFKKFYIMSKGNMLLGYARGKVGGLVFVRRGGEQVVRPYVAQVRNPQTRSQMNQRVKWPNLISAWRVLKPYIQMGMQDKKPSQSDYNAFISRNIANNTAYLLKEEAKQGAMLVAPYVLTSGSLGLCSMDSATMSSIKIGTSINLQTATIGEVSDSIIAYNANFAIGDQLTFIVLGQVITGGVPSVIPAAYKFILAESSNEVPFADAVSVYGTISPAIEDGLLGYEFDGVSYQGYGAACIHSRLSPSGILELSTSAIADHFESPAPAGQSTPFGVSKEEAIDSYGVSEGVFLNPSSFGEVEMRPVPVLISASLDGNAFASTATEVATGNHNVILTGENFDEGLPTVTVAGVSVNVTYVSPTTASATVEINGGSAANPKLVVASLGDMTIEGKYYSNPL